MKETNLPDSLLNNSLFQNTNNMFIILLGLAVVTGSIMFLFWYKRRHPKLKMGTLINKLIIENRESVFLFGAVAVNFFEAMVSASIHPVGQAPINPFTRFGTHGVVAFIAIACAIYFAQFLKSWIESIPEFIKEPGQFFIRLVLVVVSLFGMLAAPLFNLYIVANGLLEVDNVTFLLKGLVYPQYYMDYLYDLKNLPLDYDPYKAMSYVMASTVVMTLFHYLLMVLDAFTTLDRKGDSSFNFSGDLRTLDEKINERGEKEKSQDLNKFNDSVRYLLVRAGYTGSDLNAAKETASRALDTMTNKGDKILISGHLAKMVREIDAWDKGEKVKLKNEGKTKEVSDRNKKIKEDINKLFSGKIKGGHGLGMPLAKK